MGVHHPILSMTPYGQCYTLIYFGYNLPLLNYRACLIYIYQPSRDVYLVYHDIIWDSTNIKDMYVGVGGAYNVDSVLQLMVRGLDERNLK